ncbi:hypothetical protein JCM3770_002020 [Rhodotorula araucariae]
MSSAAAPPPAVPPAVPDLPSQPSDSSGTPQKPSVLDAAKTIRPLEDLQRLPQMPCARYSLLFGIVAGVSVGCLRFVFSRTARRGTLMGGGSGRWAEVGAAANWAVGAWGVGSLGAWETCRARQTAEAARMHALVSEIKARRAAKVSKSDSERERERPIGGILIGEKGKEMLREKERRRAEGARPEAEVGGGEEQPKSGGGWFSGRI